MDADKLMVKIIEQLLNIYYNEEWWHDTRLNRNSAFNYHNKLVQQGNIQIYQELGIVLGYYEVWFINKKQLKDIVMGKPFSPILQDISHGNIAYLANLWIDDKFRKGKVFKELYKRFFKHIAHCEMVAGLEQPRKGRLRVFKNRRIRWVQQRQ